MPSPELFPKRVFEHGDDRVEIENGLGETIILDLASAQQRLKNLQNEKNNFANKKVWNNQINATKKAIAFLERAESNKGAGREPKITEMIRKVKKKLRGK